MGEQGQPADMPCIYPHTFDVRCLCTFTEAPTVFLAVAPQDMWCRARAPSVLERTRAAGGPIQQPAGDVQLLLPAVLPAGWQRRETSTQVGRPGRGAAGQRAHRLPAGPQVPQCALLKAPGVDSLLCGSGLGLWQGNTLADLHQEFAACDAGPAYTIGLLWTKVGNLGWRCWPTAHLRQQNDNAARSLQLVVDIFDSQLSCASGLQAP